MPEASSAPAFLNAPKAKSSKITWFDVFVSSGHDKSFGTFVFERFRDRGCAMDRGEKIATKQKGLTGATSWEHLWCCNAKQLPTSGVKYISIPEHSDGRIDREVVTEGIVAASVQSFQQSHAAVASGVRHGTQAASEPIEGHIRLRLYNTRITSEVCKALQFRLHILCLQRLGFQFRSHVRWCVLFCQVMPLTEPHNRMWLAERYRMLMPVPTSQTLSHKFMLHWTDPWASKLWAHPSQHQSRTCFFFFETT